MKWRIGHTLNWRQEYRVGFDNLCRCKQINRRIKCVLKLEELNRVDLNARRPPAEMTDEQWQEYFAAMRLLTTQGKDKRMNTRLATVELNDRGLEYQREYHGETQWYRYCQFINSILSAIRHGEFDYCFNIYQITDLLKFEHDRLRTKWMQDNQCFQVWLA